MLRSISDGIRSLWSGPTDDEDKNSGRKRKLDEECLEPENIDSDVYIIKVAKRRKPDTNSSSFSSFFRQSLNKMGEWFGRKEPKAYSEDFRARPAKGSNHVGRTFQQRNGSIGNPSTDRQRLNMDGNGTHVPESDLERSSMSKREFTQSLEGSHRKLPFHSHAARRPSESSYFGQSKRSTASESVRLKDKEQYQKLLQLQSQQSPWRTKSPIYTSSGGSLTSDLSISMRDKNSESYHQSFLKAQLKEAERNRMAATSSLLSKQRNRPDHHLPSRPSLPGASSTSINIPRKPHEPLGYTAAPSTSWDSLPPRISLQQKTVSQGSAPLSKENKQNGDSLGMEVKMNGDGADFHQKLVSADTIVIDDDDENEHVSSRLQPAKEIHKEQKDVHLGTNISTSYLERYKAHMQERERRKREIEEEELKAKAYEEKRRIQNLSLERQMKYQMKIFDELPEVTDEIFVEEEEEEDVLPELTDDMMAVVRTALRAGNPNEVLSDGFRLQITRRDMATLAGLNWLNDEVINFYMNMLMDRGEQEGWAKVYAFNTFFYPKIMSGGHAAVKRWTKKVDIFSVHFIIIPVHLGMHWCLCVVDMKEKNILYYDSMGATNNKCLQAVLNYVNDESVVKKQTPINKSEWTLTNVEDNPQQMNGSDCGMFMCKYAEYITRQRDITFSQEDMPYFRQRMVYEIINKKLLQ